MAIEQPGGYQGGAAQPQGGGPVASQNWSPSYMDPMLQLLLGSTQQGAAGISNLNANPGANPLFAGQVDPVMAVLSRLFGQQRQDLTSTQRANGNLGDTSSGIAQGRLMGEQATSAGGTLASMMNQSYNNALAGYQANSNMAGTAARSMPMYNQTYMNPNQFGSSSSSSSSSGNSSMANNPFFSQQPSAMDIYNNNVKNGGTTPGYTGASTGGSGNGQPPPTANVQGQSIWDILRNQSGGLGNQGTNNFYQDPSTGTFTNQPSQQALQYQPQDQWGYSAGQWAQDPFYSGEGW